ncbi:IclR family transcriptional regulator domain-containing protein [Marinomonas mediterranea]|uniref:Transcriptional regulator, IclR family n=1 Tax=Marinomonas mediterranea (strain ATCC 700492 / JCM 21426 / NBRC 103028 / MMB-1) TaxID=717774 RepID=F2JV87_MARM1|nr:IclR family transcriptional regulator C-terminal domain-containing protein [Marinomonas mediterranea]ADZ92845.1 transcriptional regulator, IclR family [Marinomonas mediterranea MMB-1]WCN10778.1 helix-turn-helix domain-containing protein [Marinomonas mediterranea]WCN18867.1 helix-turn-helix domain-containing protein [Marinomonas mediterranea MMB-1]
MSEEKLSPDHRDYVGALASGLDVLNAFDSSHSTMTLSEVAEQAGMDRAKARRFLLTLHSLGYIDRDGRQFRLTPKVLGLSSAYGASNDHISVVEHYLRDVTTRLGESSSLGVLDQHDIIYVVRSPAAHRLMSISLSAGTRLPAAYTSMGRVLVSRMPKVEQRIWLDSLTLEAFTEHSITDPVKFEAMLDQVRAQDYCVVDQELDLGLRSLAVPAVAYNGDVLGAINLSTNASRVSHQALVEECLPVLKDAVEQIRLHTK